MCTVQCRVYFLCPDLWFRHLGNKWLDLTPGSYSGSRDQVRDHDHPRSSLVLYGIRAHIIGLFSPWKPPIPYAIKNQPRGILRSKPPSRGLWMRQAGSLWHKRSGVATLWSSRPMRGENTDPAKPGSDRDKMLITNGSKFYRVGVCLIHYRP